jgi:hypothetical protein
MRKLVLVGLVACGALSAPGMALADPREDVVSGVARCAVLTDDRQWLDCYYGAAQPMRASLGLAPAPQAQVKLLSAQSRAGAAILPTTVARAAVRTGPPPMPKRSGLLDIWGGDDIVNNAPIKAYDLSGDGFTVTLQDGQVWQQTPDDASKRPVRWRQPASSMRVSITQAAMHTFNLVVGDENTHHKVKRIR